VVVHANHPEEIEQGFFYVKSSHYNPSQIPVNGKDGSGRSREHCVLYSSASDLVRRTKVDPLEPCSFTVEEELSRVKRGWVGRREGVLAGLAARGAVRCGAAGRAVRCGTVARWPRGRPSWITTSPCRGDGAHYGR
jgi:hypothetical protein